MDFINCQMTKQSCCVDMRSGRGHVSPHSHPDIILHSYWVSTSNCTRRKPSDSTTKHLHVKIKSFCGVVHIKSLKYVTLEFRTVTTMTQLQSMVTMETRTFHLCVHIEIPPINTTVSRSSIIEENVICISVWRPTSTSATITFNAPSSHLALPVKKKHTDYTRRRMT